MSTPFRLQIPRQLYDAMIAQALTEMPNECCGLLAGRIVAQWDGSAGSSLRIGKVERRYPLINELASSTESLSEPRSMFEAFRDMRRLEIDVLAVYHSHPTTEPVPSRKDLERNYSCDVVNLIISFRGVEPSVRGWWLTDKSYREGDWEVVA